MMFFNMDYIGNLNYARTCNDKVANTNYNLMIYAGSSYSPMQQVGVDMMNGYGVIKFEAKYDMTYRARIKHWGSASMKSDFTVTFNAKNSFTVG